MTKDAFQDLRSPKLIKAHDVLGLELFNQGRDAQKKLIEQQPNLLDYFGIMPTVEKLINTRFLSSSQGSMQLSWTWNSRKTAVEPDISHRSAWRPFRWNTYHRRFDLADRGPPIAQSHPCASPSD
ncbi:MAG: hypothetical protein ACXWU5_06380, partial [Rhodoplanes sp.]